VTLGLAALPRFLYWRLRRKPADAVHMLGALARAAVTWFRLRRRLGRISGGRPTLAIVLVERIGDIVAAEPIARLARSRFPAIDDVIAVGCLTEWLLLEPLGLFDHVWNLHMNGADCPRCQIARDDPTVAPNRRDYYRYGNLLTVQCLCAGLPPVDDGPRLAPPAEAVAAITALALPPRRVVLHAVSSDDERKWTVGKWRDLVARILAADRAAIIVEIGLVSHVIRRDEARQRALCGRLSPLETAALISSSALFVGIDSGPAHIANAVGTPGVILLGRYRGFQSYTPYSGGYADGGRATLLRADGPAAELTVDAVFAAVMARLESV
jgi:hypothetical protein